MRYSKFILLFIMLIGLACSTHIPPPATPLKERESKIYLPWYIAQTPQNSSDYIYGIGSGRSVEEAIISAKKSIVSYYKQYVESEIGKHSVSDQLNDREYYRDYLSQQINIISNLNIPGISITETDQIGDTYYSLATLEKRVLEESQRAIKQEILTTLELGNSQNDPGLKLQAYYLVTSLLSKLIEPLEYEGKLIFIYLTERINAIFTKLEIAYTFAEHSKYVEYSGLIIKISSQEGVLTGIPLLLGDDSHYPDKEGNYYIKNSFNEPSNLLVKVDVNRIKLSSELQGREISDAMKLIKLITPFEQNIHIIPPLKIKAFVEVLHYIDSEKRMNLQLENQIKNYLLQKKINLTSNQQEASMQIRATTFANESSYNQYLGYAYKGEGDIKIKGVNQETVIINLSDDQTKESTKSFAKQRNQSAALTTEKLNRLLIDKLEAIQLDN